MAIKAEILRSSDIRPKIYCPECGARSVTHRSTYHADIALCDFEESCTLCGWSRTLENVKAG